MGAFYIRNYSLFHLLVMPFLQDINEFNPFLLYLCFKDLETGKAIYDSVMFHYDCFTVCFYILN